MPGTPLASLQFDRVARSSQQTAAFGPFADALKAHHSIVCAWPELGVGQFVAP
jgi:hypothetical protein